MAIAVGRRRPTVAYQQHAPTRHTSHGTTTGIVGGGKMYLMTTPKVEEGTSLVVSFEGAPWSFFRCASTVWIRTDRTVDQQ
jgi:hypothetical protein